MRTERAPLLVPKHPMTDGTAEDELAVIVLHRAGAMPKEAVDSRIEIRD
jgi:hypothetical protein